MAGKLEPFGVCLSAVGQCAGPLSWITVEQREKMKEALKPLKPHRAAMTKSAFAEKLARHSENTPNVRKSAFAAGGKKATKAIGKKRAATRRRPSPTKEEDESALDASMDIEASMEESVVATEKAKAKQKKKASLADEEVTSHELYISLLEKYQYLQSLRETKMEQLYNKLQDDIVAKNDASDKLIASLRRQVEQQEQRLQAVQREAREQEAKVKMLELLTSLQLTAAPEADGTRPEGPFVAKLFGKVKDESGQTVMIPLAKLRESMESGRPMAINADAEPAVVFKTWVNGDQEVEYSPQHIRSDVKERLEHYLMEDIAFDTTEAPQFLSKLLECVLNDEEYDDDEEEELLH